MTPPELQVEHGLALLNWADLAKRAVGKTNGQSDIHSRFEKDKCACRSFPFQAPHTAQAFQGKSRGVTNATLLARFEPLPKELAAYAGKKSMEGNDEIQRHLYAVLGVINRLKRGDAQSDSWTREDMQIGIRATALLNRLQRKVRPSLPPQPRQLQERPPWRR